jgi:hypothetical protein
MSDETKPKHAGGRPTKYKAEYCLTVEYMTRCGMTEAQIADKLDIHIDTIQEWKHVHPEFSESLKEGKEAPDDLVEKSLFTRATGYTFDSEKIVIVSDGKDVGSHWKRVPIKEHCPPDVTAQIFWLKNRRPEKWRDKQDIDVNLNKPLEIKVTHDTEGI